MNNNKPNYMTDSNGYVYEIPPMEEKKPIDGKNPKKDDDDNKGYTIGFIILIIIVVGVIGTVFYFTFFDKEEEVFTPEVVDIDYGSKIDVSEVGRFSKYNNSQDVLLKLNNKNYAFVLANIVVTFYDAEGNMTDKQEVESIAISKSSSSYVKISTSYSFERYDTKISASNISLDYKDYVSSLTKKTTKRDDNISVEINNTEDKAISNIQVCVIFYKDNNVVGFDVGKLNTIDALDTEVINVSVPTDTSTRNNISYDSYEVRLYSGYASK